LIVTYAFTSESGAEKFCELVADQFLVETEVLSYLHVEVDESELPADPEVFDRLSILADHCGAEDVLL
jgi:hypothetical protein